MPSTQGIGLKTHHIVCLEECYCPVPVSLFTFPHSYTGYFTTSIDNTEIILKLREATIAITTVVPITPDILDQCPRLECVVIMATGVEWVLPHLNVFKERHVRVLNTPHANVDSVSEHAIALYFAARRKVVQMHNLTMRSNEYAEKRTLTQRFSPDGPPHGVKQETLAILGYGAIGKRIGTLASGLGMQVLIAEHKGVRGTDVREGRSEFEAAIRQATVVMVTMPKSRETVNLLDEEELRTLRKEAVVVNVARGGIIDETALVKALREGWIAGAATDVFNGEPPVRGESVLLDENIPNLTISPHLGWFMATSVRNMQDLLVKELEGYVAGALIHVVC